MKHFALAALAVSLSFPVATSSGEVEAPIVSEVESPQPIRTHVSRPVAIPAPPQARPQAQRNFSRGSQHHNAVPRVPQPRTYPGNPNTGIPQVGGRREWARRGTGEGQPGTTPRLGIDQMPGRSWQRNRGDWQAGRGVWQNRENSWQRRGDRRTGNFENRDRDWRQRQDWQQRQEWQQRRGTGRRDWNRGDWSQRHRHWNRQHRHRSWWKNHYTRFAVFAGGTYYLYNNYWYPAYGYDPYFTSYTYDAPLYAYNGLAPAQVIAEVQAELQRLGYYYGHIDGTYGPLTRSALLRYQRDYGLPVTGHIDEETLASLGFE